jgi:hypothetical protein
MKWREKMATFEKLRDEQLEDVVGGVSYSCVINTHSDSNAVIRKSPALKSGRKTSLPNNTVVNVCGDGVYNFDDGRTWYPIDKPLKGWIVGRSIGLPD